MSTTNPRLGHAALAAILHDMNRYLPPDTIDRPGYKHCRTTYGLMNTTYQRSETSDDPEKEYKKLRALERDLRRRLNLLDVSKGVPEKMVQSMDELRLRFGYWWCHFLGHVCRLTSHSNHRLPNPRLQRRSGRGTQRAT
jgi:hypothetical protein